MIKYHELVTCKDLFEKYEETLVVKKLNSIFQRFPDKKTIRIWGKENQNKFIDYYNSLDDFEKIRYINILYHAVPKNSEYPCEEWSWVLDIKYRVKTRKNR